MVRDAQRQRVYNAQTGVPRGREWRTIPDMQAYVDRVLASALWRRYFRSITQVTIAPARWNAKGSMALREATGGTIRLRVGDYHQLILFHELAHLAQPPESAGHRPEFCEIYLRMVFHWMGEGTVACLEYGFKAQRVQVAPSATPLRRICLHLHGAAWLPSGVIQLRRRPGRSLGDLDS
jgi:putative metallohydrolase (TIGR04338 family)